MRFDDTRHEHLRPKICVSGAAETGHCGEDALDKAKALGREIADQGAVLVTGATTGFPLWAAMGCKEAGGISLGLSPAASEEEHTEVYGLPLEYLDLIIYTGFGFSGRNLLLTRSSDAVVCGCGRVGTINEFTVAYEDGKPLGVLEGDWTTDEVIKNMLEKSHRKNDKVIFEEDPKKMIEKMLKMVKEEKAKGYRLYRTPENGDAKGDVIM
ncbi:MAG: hypothetical protein Q8Q18_01575 [bacterium]|nr:hypothetical protein [bacterium]